MESKSVTFRIIQVNSDTRKKELIKSKDDFEITVNKTNYVAQTITGNGFIKYKIYSRRGYLFTIMLDDNDSWIREDADNNANADLINKIGNAIKNLQT
jgi:hypothetical protein